MAWILLMIAGLLEDDSLHAAIDCNDHSSPRNVPCDRDRNRCDRRFSGRHLHPGRTSEPGAITSFASFKTGNFEGILSGISNLSRINPLTRGKQGRKRQIPGKGLPRRKYGSAS